MRMFAGSAIWAAPVFLAMALGQGSADAQQLSDLEAVETTHEAYHAAFGKEDMDLMSEVWHHDQTVRLIVPPSDKVLTGWDEVKRSFDGAFENLDVISLDMRDVQTIVGEEVAWIVDVHGLEMRTGDGNVIKPDFFSTHVFQKVVDRWLMVHHQASVPPAPTE